MSKLKDRWCSNNDHKNYFGLASHKFLKYSKDENSILPYAKWSCIQI